MNTASIKPRFPAYGFLGIAIVGLAEVLLFAGNSFVGHWFTPIVWTGFILVADALVYKLKRRSLLMNDRLEFLTIAIVSIASWWLFELYNAPRFWNSELELWWHYHNLEPNLFLRRAGYDWAFATISLGLFETAELFALTAFAGKKPGVAFKLSRSMMIALVVIGAIGSIVPLLYPSDWFAPVVWLSIIFLIDPLNAWRGRPSIIGDLARGNWRRLLSLLASGFVCGVLWEFWNYWALAKWTYTVPYLGSIKIFEMPVLGFLGFPPFAVECWVMYIFIRSLLNPVVFEADTSEIFLRAAN
jgi:hypothetical protein